MQSSKTRDTLPEFPRARREDIVVVRMPGECLAYDLRRHRTHVLNAPAAFVWERCDGHTSLATLADKVEKELGLRPGGVVVEAALRRLQRAGLVEIPREGSQGERGLAPPAPHPNRRKILRQLARAGIALPTVFTLVAPLAAQAGTKVTPSQCFWNYSHNAGKCCTNNRRCIHWTGGFGICLGAWC